MDSGGVYRDLSTAARAPVTRSVCERIAARKKRNMLKKKGMTSRGGGTRHVPSDGVRLVRVIVARGTETRDKLGSVTGAMLERREVEQKSMRRSPKKE